MSAPEAQIECARKCSGCEIESPLSCFYKKGARYESKCKDCLKKQRADDYRKKNHLSRANGKCKIDRVMMKEIKVMKPDQFRREMEAVELILENLIYKVLSKKFCEGNSNA